MGVLRVAPDGSVREMNEVLTALLDVAGGDDVRDLNIYDFAPLDECGLAGFVRLCFAENRPRISEGGCRTPAGDDIYLRYFLHPLPGDGAPEQVLVYVTDLTRINATAEELRRIYKQFDSIVSGMSPLMTMDEN